jgi:hypothetical protein
MSQAFFEKMNIPKVCEINKPIFKKLFLDNGGLDATDKKILKDDVDKIRWAYTLKPSTINISAYQDEQREYLEVAVLQIDLTNASKLKRIAGFIQKSIPYPIVLVFTHDDNFCISVADKRISQADKSKLVIEDSWITEWINPASINDAQSQFMEDCAINKLPFTNFYAFYQGLKDCIIALIASTQSGVYILENNIGKNTKQRVLNLQEIDKLNVFRSELQNKLKKEKQMGKQVEINTKIKQINDQLNSLKQKL